MPAVTNDTLKSTEFTGIATELAREIASLDPEYRARLLAAGFEPRRLLQLAGTIDPERNADAAARRDARNRIEGDVRAPAPGEILSAPSPGSPDENKLGAIGEAALRRGELAFCVMAGGMATRMGGVVKALVEAFDGRTFLDLRLAENATMSARAGRPIPLWLMTSEATDAPIKAALLEKKAPAHVQTFMQDLSLRLTPDGHLFIGADGLPSAHATGHGDLPDALRRSGLITKFRANGGKYVWIANLDNLGAAIDKAILGAFVAAEKDVMVEVCDKVKGDRGGIPVYARGRLQVLEEFRLPKGFDAASVTVFNTNTFLVRASALEDAQIAWTYFEVEKKVEGRPALQFERLLQELTAVLPSTYIRVPRDGDGSRFLPVKDDAELKARKQEIAAVAKKRGMVPPPKNV
jgi:UTP--glucose-1-phosphate uridylyltransferase